MMSFKCAMRHKVTNRNKSAILLVFVSAYSVTAAGTYSPICIDSRAL